MEEQAAMGLKREGENKSGPPSKKQQMNSLEPAAQSDAEQMQQLGDTNTEPQKDLSELRSAKAFNSDGKQTLVVALLAVLSLLIFTPFSCRIFEPSITHSRPWSFCD